MPDVSQIFGKYVLEREIAAGGMAKVFLGTLRGAVGFEKRLVVKQIRPELASDDAFVRRFVEEAKTAVELSHPNIVPVYELGVEQGIYYIAMELCEGLTLAEVLRETGTLSPEEGAYVGIEICRALDYAHRRASIVHRDVTPRNVLIDDEGAVRIIDFGIAAPATLPGETGKHELFGSPGHMPPEQIGGRTLTPASDVFAVGALLVEAWTGKAPFRRGSVSESLEALKSAPPRIDEDNAELAPLADLVASTLALEPAKRPQTAELVGRPLRAFVKNVDLGDVARRMGTRVRRTRRKSMASISDAVTASSPVETRPLRASIGDTQTFAVRNDLVEWTRKISSVMPPPPEAVVEPVPPSEVDATRRLDESVDAETAVSTRPTSTAPRRGLTIAAIGAIAVAAVAGARFFSQQSPPISPVSTPIPTVGSAIPAVSTPEPSAPPSSSSKPAPSERPIRTAPAVSDSARAPSDAVGKGKLNLTAAPNSQVTVAGKTLSTPALGIELPAGTYPVMFTNTTLNDRASASVTLGAGQTRSVHVDFSGERPNVIVH